MLFKRSLILFMFLALVLGCSSSEDKKEPAKPSANPETIKKIKVEKKGSLTPEPIVATKYSDKKEWNNGINIKTGKMFFFNLPKNVRNPVSKGCRVRLAASGEMVVQEVSSMDSADKSSSSIFVTVDRPLDPNGDGSPNPIQILSVAITAAAYTEKGEYLNGVHLTRKGLFYLVKKSTDFFPIKKGSRMKFAKAGEATVTELSLLSSKTPGYTVYFIVVDRVLDPKGDGFPNPIELLFNN